MCLLSVTSVTLHRSSQRAFRSADLEAHVRGALTIHTLWQSSGCHDMQHSDKQPFMILGQVVASSA